MANWADTETISEATWNDRERRITDLEDIIDLRDTAVRLLCIALHGAEIEGKTIYDLIVDADHLRKRLMSASQ